MIKLTWDKSSNELAMIIQIQIMTGIRDTEWLEAQMMTIHQADQGTDFTIDPFFKGFK